MRILAVIPAYNEEACLAQTVSQLRAACPDVDYLVVNDGSRDGTRDVMEQNGLNGISLPINCGLTSAFKAGMKYALAHGYDAVVQFDADGQHLPQYIPAMARALEEKGADIVIGSRLLEGGAKLPGLRGIGSSLISALIKLTAKTQVSDPTSGMRMYSRRMIERFATGFDCAPEPDTVARVARTAGPVVEVPVTMQERQGGVSYLNLGASVLYMARTCLAILIQLIPRKEA